MANVRSVAHQMPGDMPAAIRCGSAGRMPRQKMNECMLGPVRSRKGNFAGL